MGQGPDWKRLFRLETSSRHIEEHIEDEFAFHIEARTEQLMEEGMPEAEARSLARSQFGDRSDYGTDCRREGVERLRRQSFRDLIDSVWRDMRIGGRMLRRSPGYATLILICLGLGIGATTSIFSVLNAVAIKRLPFEEPGRLTMVWETFWTRNMLEGGVSYPNLAEWRQRNQVFSDIGGFHPARHTLTGLELPERIFAARADSRFFPTLGVDAAIGRLFTPEDEETGATEVVVLTDQFWRRLHDADPAVIGEVIELDGRSHVIIGVLPAGFDFPVRVAGAEVWTTTTSEFVAKEQRAWPVMTAVGRLRPGIRTADAQEHMAGLALQLQEDFPETNTEHGFNIVSLQKQTAARVRPLLMLLLGSVALVLLIACTNVANLMLARIRGRQSQLAVSAAIGAGRHDLIRQMLSESAVLALLGGFLGVVIAFAGTKILVSFMPVDFPRLAEIGVNGPVLIFTLLLSLLTGLVFGLVPALQAARVDPASTLNEAGRHTAGRKHNLTRRILVVIETAMALILLTGAGLLIRSFSNMMAVDPGFDPDRVLTFSMSRNWSDYHVINRAAFYVDLSERLTRLPGVEAAGAGTALPLSGGFMATFYHEGARDIPDGERPLTRYLSVTPSYFNTLGIPLIRGRALTVLDGREQPGAVVVNQAAARAFWPDEDPLGRRIYPDVDITTYDPTEFTVVGIVGDVQDITLDTDAGPCIYVPCTQQTWPNMTFAVRTSGDPMLVAGAVRNEVLSMTEEASFSFRSLDQNLQRSITQRRFPMTLLTLFALLALVLAATGIYGILSCSVVERTREIGIRMALGAQSRQVVVMFLKQGMGLVALGVVVGLPAGLALSRLIEGMLFGITPTDPATSAGVVVILLAVALSASYLPVRRAAGINPVETLGSE
ncbi:ADOP family duplicated permease [Gemmatimonadota bacterium]